MTNLHDWLISLTSAIIGGFFTWLITWKYRRTAEDAIKEDIQIKANDEIRAIFSKYEDNYQKYSIRVTMENGAAYLITAILQLNAATGMFGYAQVMENQSDAIQHYGVALIRFSAIAMIRDNDPNRHWERAAKAGA